MTKDSKDLIDNTINHVTIYDMAFPPRVFKLVNKLSKCCGHYACSRRSVYTVYSYVTGNL